MSPDERRASSEHAMRVIAALNDGLMGCAIADPATVHTDHEDEKNSSPY